MGSSAGVPRYPLPEQHDWRRLLDRSMSCNWNVRISTRFMLTSRLSLKRSLCKAINKPLYSSNKNSNSQLLLKNTKSSTPSSVTPTPSWSTDSATFSFKDVSNTAPKIKLTGSQLPSEGTWLIFQRICLVVMSFKRLLIVLMRKLKLRWSRNYFVGFQRRWVIGLLVMFGKSYLRFDGRDLFPWLWSMSTMPWGEFGPRLHWEKPEAL